MAFDFNEAREIIEAAKKRGMIRAAGEAAPIPVQNQAAPDKTVFPEWLKDSISDPSIPKGFEPGEDRTSSR